jgi:hypothetical protein
MNPFSAFRSYSRRSGGALLLVGVLAGVTVGGGVGVIAASTTKSVTVCANKKTNMLRYAKNGRCKKKTETKVLLNQSVVSESFNSGTNGATGPKGDTGSTGATGPSGVNGINGADGINGTNGANGTDGADGINGTNGANGRDGADGINGTNGANGRDGADGTNGTNGANGRDGADGINGTNGANGTDGADGINGTNGANGRDGSSFSSRSVCGANGTTLCAIGLQGPGGGTVFYVDTDGRYSEFDYLEYAPADASNGVVWSTAALKCGLTQTQSCQSNFISTSGEALNFLAIGTGRAATAAIVARHDAASVPKTDYAAGVADAYTTSTAADWFLPSRDELNEVCKYARSTGQAPGASTECLGYSLLSGFWTGGYWSSSDFETGGGFTSFWTGRQWNLPKEYDGNHVRPVRSF